MYVCMYVFVYVYVCMYKTYAQELVFVIHRNINFH